MKGSRFESADLRDSRLENASFLKEWARRPKSSLYLIGCYGSGKTWTAHAIVNELKKFHRPPYFYHFMIESPNLERELREGILKGYEADILQKWAEAPLFVIDDLGREQMSERVQQQYYCLLNERYKFKRPTIVTSNFEPSELKLEAASISRMQDWTFIRFPNKDNRSKNIKEKI